MSFEELSTMFSSLLPENWERQDKLNVELTGYGWGETRMVTHMYLPKDTDLSKIKTTFSAISRDIKHSHNWDCEFCGEPAREALFQYITYSTSKPPQLIIYVHCICDMDETHVREGLTAIHNMFRGMGAAGPVAPYAFYPKHAAGVTFPLAASCAGCERDETVTGEGDEKELKRCSGCRVTRYCGSTCQEKDWGRHKLLCGVVHAVAFENFDLPKCDAYGVPLPNYETMSYKERGLRWLRSIVLYLLSVL